ncbi:hypothetical protein KUTeg_024814 [Tegillarca granosa]|uniref:Uncharacterized protein n=1 Tax=Tegillarca granosa TaxID=220873 RepID=A0ABQ9DYE9_TEGGR|nr:hypothetical protein KUTeg_024814 [Tegillarca granosa]
MLISVSRSRGMQHGSQRPRSKTTCIEIVYSYQTLQEPSDITNAFAYYYIFKTTMTNGNMMYDGTFLQQLLNESMTNFISAGMFSVISLVDK